MDYIDDEVKQEFMWARQAEALANVERWSAITTEEQFRVLKNAIYGELRRSAQAGDGARRQAERIDEVIVREKLRRLAALKDTRATLSALGAETTDTDLQGSVKVFHPPRHSMAEIVESNKIQEPTE